MSTSGGFAVLDGTQLRGIDLSRADQSPLTLTGAQVIELAESKASGCMYGLSLPASVKHSALGRVGIPDEGSYRGQELGAEVGLEKAKEYVAAIADELRENPIVVSVLDGSTLRLYLEDEDDFAMLAENLFTELDAEDTGKIKKSEIRKALDHMGVDMGVPPLSELPLLDDILRKHRAEAEEGVGQAQFAQLLQLVLHDLADTLAKRQVLFIHNVKVVNGSKIRKLLDNEKQLVNITEKILNLSHGQGDVGTVRKFLEENGADLGLPPLDINETAALYDAVFSIPPYGNCPLGSGKDECAAIVKDILEKFAEKLESDPIFVDLAN